MMSMNDFDSPDKPLPPWAGGPPRKPPEPPKKPDIGKVPLGDKT